MHYDDSEYPFWLYVDDRRNIWHFHYFVAKNFTGFLGNFCKIAKFPDESSSTLTKEQSPSEETGLDTMARIDEMLNKIMVCWENGGYPHEDATLDTTQFHILMNLLPYFNDRHYTLSRYEYENFQGEVWCSFEDMKNLDRTIARRIAPVIRDFSECSQFPPDHFYDIYSYPWTGKGFHGLSRVCDEWRKALATMADAWEWLAGRDPVVVDGRWEAVPEDIYYGLHLFAEYLPEMQND